MLEQTIKNAYAELMEATTQLTQATINLIKAKQELEAKYDVALVNGVVQGSNERARDAWKRTTFAAEQQAVNTAEQAYEEAKGYHALKQIAVAEIESLLTIEIQ